MPILHETREMLMLIVTIISMKNYTKNDIAWKEQMLG